MLRTDRIWIKNAIQKVSKPRTVFSSTFWKADHSDGTKGQRVHKVFLGTLWTPFSDGNSLVVTQGSSGNRFKGPAASTQNYEHQT